MNPVHKVIHAYERVKAPFIPYGSLTIDASAADFVHALTAPAVNTLSSLFGDKTTSKPRDFSEYCTGCRVRYHLTCGPSATASSKVEWTIIEQWAHSWLQTSHVPFSGFDVHLPAEASRDPDLAHTPYLCPSCAPLHRVSLPPAPLPSSLTHPPRPRLTRMTSDTTPFPPLSAPARSRSRLRLSPSSLLQPQPRAESHIPTCPDTPEHRQHSSDPAGSYYSTIPPAAPPPHAFLTMATLSVRSALDLYLSASAFPAGALVLLSAINIPDVSAVLRAHALVPVPVDVDLHTCALPLQRLRAALRRYGTLAHTPAASGTPGRVCCVLVAHIFGRRNDITPLACECRAWGVPLIEDAAEARVDTAYTGNVHASLSLFSFGAIKHGTAFGGGLARVADSSVYWRMRALLEAQPQVSDGAYARKVAKLAPVFAALTQPVVARAVVGTARLCGLEYRERTVAMLRGFKHQGDLVGALRHQPPRGLLLCLSRRLRMESDERLHHASAVGALCEQALQQLRADVGLVGCAATVRGHWLFPVAVRAPEQVCAELGARGVDVYRGATQLRAVEVPPELAAEGAEDGEDDGCCPVPVRAQWLISHVLYLPVHRRVPQPDILRIAAAVTDVVGTRSEASSSDDDWRILCDGDATGVSGVLQHTGVPVMSSCVHAML